MAGRGFLLNDENGRTYARYIATGAMRGNSVDLAEVKARFVEDFETGDYWVEFYEFKVAATTGVSKPAFAEAHAVVDELSDDELMASLVESPMTPLVCEFADDASFCIVGVDEGEELVASGALLAAFDDFYMPEADAPTKVVVDADGRVYGHLALWESCHDGFADKCMRVPRPMDGYASFNKAGVLTDRGRSRPGRSSRSAVTVRRSRRRRSKRRTAASRTPGPMCVSSRAGSVRGCPAGSVPVCPTRSCTPCVLRACPATGCRDD